jgi:arginase family enzyme
MTCPGLRIISSNENLVIVEHPWTGACYSLEPLYASLLNLLKTPEHIDMLCGEEGMVPRYVVNHLLQNGLLIDADNQTATHLMRRSLPTFLRCPEGDLGMAQVCVIGMPFDRLSDTGAGAAGGASLLRLAASFPVYEIDIDGNALGWFDYYENCHVLQGVTFADAGDIPVRVGASAEETGERLYKAVESCRRLNSFPLILGGDHSLTAWALAALAVEEVSVLHLDAHSDLGEYSTFNQPTNGSFARAVLEQKQIEHWVSVGVRGFLPVRQTPLTANHHIVSANQVREMTAQSIIELLPADRPCYVTLDIDVLDPSIAPGTNTPVPNGLTFEEVRILLREVGRRRTVIGADLVEVNPQRDPQMLTARAGVHLILSLLAAALPHRDDEAVEAKADAS